MSKEKLERSRIENRDPSRFEKVASITKHKNMASTIEWLQRIPQKYPLDRVRNLLLIVRAGNFILWTEKHGLKIL